MDDIYNNSVTYVKKFLYFATMTHPTRLSFLHDGKLKSFLVTSVATFLNWQHLLDVYLICALFTFPDKNKIKKADNFFECMLIKSKRFFPPITCAPAFYDADFCDVCCTDPNAMATVTKDSYHRTSLSATNNKRKLKIQTFFGKFLEDKLKTRGKKQREIYFKAR